MPIRPRWRGLTLRARLTSAASLAVAVLIAVAGLLLVWRVHAGLLDGVDTAVAREATTVAATVDGPGPVQVPAAVGRSFTVQVADASGHVVASSADVEGEPRMFAVGAAAAGSPPAVGTERVAALDAARFRVAALRAGPASGSVVYVALDLQAVTRGTRQLVTALAVGAPALFAALVALTWFLAGRALHPVEVLRRQAAEIDGAAVGLGRRVDVPPTDDELSRLAVTLNDLLGRLSAAQLQQRQFVADAAHELRSPVAAIRVQLETAQADVVVGAALTEESARLSRLVDDLLSLARLDTRPPLRHEDMDLGDLVRAEARSLVLRTGLVVDTQGVNPVRVVGDEGLLARAVRNLLDNAGRYAYGHVEIALRLQGRTAVLSIADDGPGIPPADRTRVFDRFTRLDQDRSRDGGGVGLGLAIVHDIVTAHGGTVRIEGEQPGAQVVVRLPVEAADGAP